MTSTPATVNKRWRRVLIVGAVLVLVASLVWLYVYTHPLVFNESFWHHAHCIKHASIVFDRYADENDGRFPTHPDGYGNALLLLLDVDDNCAFALTGPGYEAAPFTEAKASGGDLPEEACGRVYVQGLTNKSDATIALLFDKLPTPGGDHCHFPMRLWAPLGREVLFVDGNSRFVKECDWPDFVAEQIELLVKAGFRREEAERLYASKPRYSRLLCENAYNKGSAERSATMNEAAGPNSPQNWLEVLNEEKREWDRLDEKFAQLRTERAYLSKALVAQMGEDELPTGDEIFAQIGREEPLREFLMEMRAR